MTRQAGPWCPSGDPPRLSLTGPRCICTPSPNRQLSCMATATNCPFTMQTIRENSKDFPLPLQIYAFICTSFYNLSPTHFFSACVACWPSPTATPGFPSLSSARNFLPHQTSHFADYRALTHPPDPSEVSSRKPSSSPDQCLSPSTQNSQTISSISTLWL